MCVRKERSDFAAVGSRPYTYIVRLSNRVVIVGLFLRRANGVRPYGFVAISLCLTSFIQFSSYVRGVTLGIMP